MFIRLFRTLSVIAMLSVLCSAHAFANDDIWQVEAWTGNVSVNYQYLRAKNEKTIVISENISEDINASLVLDKKSVESDGDVVWEGTASCNVNLKVHWLQEVPKALKTVQEGSSSKVIETPAKLVMDPSRNKYTVSLCKKKYTYMAKTTTTIVNTPPVTKTSATEVMPMGLSATFHAGVSGSIPEKGNHLTDSYDLPYAGNDSPKEVNEILGLFENALGESGIEVSGNVRWSLSPDVCHDGGNYKVEITWPREDGMNHVFRDNKLTPLASPGSDHIKFEASASNKDYQAIDWRSLPEIPDSKRRDQKDSSPIEELGIMKLWYEGIPEKNDSFGEYEITATLGGLERCTKEGKRKFRVFFERDGLDSPPDAPNWFYYWFQTSAGQGHYDQTWYDANCEAGVGGWYNGWENPDIIHICEGVQDRFDNDRWGIHAEGIDAFAITVMHEWQHRLNWYDWWWEFYRDNKPLDSSNPEEWEKYLRLREIADSDHDNVPIWVDKDPLNADADHDGYRDSEPSAYLASKNWKKGSADKEDWACPGKQCD